MSGRRGHTPSPRSTYTLHSCCEHMKSHKQELCGRKDQVLAVASIPANDSSLPSHRSTYKLLDPAWF